MLESEIESYLVLQVRILGGEIRKVRWVARNHAPDRFVMLPGRALWIELKKPGEKPKEGQLREHARMRAAGQRVEVIDSKQGVDEALR